MQIKKPRDLSLGDLPHIESPFSAGAIVSQQTNELTSSLRWQPTDVPGYEPNRPLPRHLALPILVSELRAGELFLVLGTADGKPFDPVIIWQEGNALPGRWALTRKVFGQNLEQLVARLNDWQITPEQIHTLGPGGVGSLSASSFDSDLRARQNRERENAKQANDNNLKLPLGAAATIAPLAAQATAAPTKEEKPRKALHLEVGLFLDGTLNNAGNIEMFNQEVEKTCLAPRRRGEIDDAECEKRLALMMGGSYGNAETNIVKLFSLYKEENSGNDRVLVRRASIYSPGVGTTTGQSDSLISSATGLWGAGILKQVQNAFKETTRRARLINNGERIHRLTIDLFGFSRGAAAARHAASEIGLGENGLLAREFRDAGISWPKEVVIRFVGLFDTVAGIVNILEGDFSASNNKITPIALYLNPRKVQTAIHLTASDECRETFSLNSLRSADGSLPDNFREIALPGAHSDIGGGYPEVDLEHVQLARKLSISDGRTEHPRSTLEWDNLKMQLDKVISEGWVGEHSIKSATGGTPYIGIKEAIRHHPSPYGRVDLILEMRRQLRGEYSRIGLRLMQALAIQSKVPLDDPSELEHQSALPDELRDIHRILSEQIVDEGLSSPSLDTAHIALLKQRYIHHSDNFNSIEFLAGKSVSGIEMPFEPLMPFTPSENRARIVHPNTPEAS